MRLSDVLGMGGTSPSATSLRGEGATVMAYSFGSADFDLDSLQLVPLSATDPSAGLPLGSSGLLGFRLWHFARVLENGVCVLGELSKFVPSSPQRLQQVSYDATSVTVQVAGSEGERVTLFFAFAGLEVAAESCVVGADLQCAVTHSVK